MSEISKPQKFNEKKSVLKIPISLMLYFQSSKIKPVPAKIWMLHVTPLKIKQ